nr:ImmA/IrrE family metallo-endopeptidase [Lysinibacillus fusiformis]
MFCWEDSSQALFSKNNSFIFLKEQLTSPQQWQDFCHELGQVLLHTGNQQRMYPLFRESKNIRQTTLCTMPVSPLLCWMN